MALQNLKTYFSESNINDFKQLLNQTCVVTEKIQASSFHVQNSDIGFKFFKSGNKKPMDKVDRTIVKYYETAISYLDSLSEDIKSQMPTDWKFGFDYMINPKTIDIKYDKLPKNNLMLTHIQVLTPGEETSIKKVIRDPKILFKWADILQVQRPQVIFEGTLNGHQKDELVNLMSLSDDEYSIRFMDNKFTRTLYSIFNKALNLTALNNSLDSQIDSLIISFFDGPNVKNFKISEIFKSEVEERTSSDIYQIAILDFVEFFTTYNLESIELVEDEADERYIELICEIFNDYIKKNATRYIGVKFNSADFANSPEFKVNIKFIKNEKTISLISNNVLEELFRIALGSFRKKRTKESNIINKDLMEQINQIVDKIEDLVMLKQNEQNLMTFNTYLKHDKLKGQDNPILQESELLSFSKFLEKNI